MDPEDIAEIVSQVEVKLKKESKRVLSAMYKQNVKLNETIKSQQEIISKLETIIKYYERLTKVNRNDIKIKGLRI